MGISSAFIAAMAYICYFNNMRLFGEPLSSLIIFVLISIVTGTTITFFVGKRILTPLSEITAAAKEVAKGDFSVRVDEEQKVQELGETIRTFNMMVHELSGIETLRNDFIVNVSHEFKTPIAAIEGYATLLREKNLSPKEYDEYTLMIIQSARQLSTLSGNILRISKLENQGFIADKCDFRLDEQIRQAILQLEPEWSKKEINLNIDLQKVTFHGNKELVMQVWSNLIGNAVKFSHQNGNITVSLISADGFVQVIVSDDGIGMSEEIKKHIFEKFYQGDSARSGIGNGLGLALAKRIIELCGGEIDVNSTDGNGTAFMVRLPMTDYTK